MGPLDAEIILARREYRRRQLWHELRRVSWRLGDLVDELMSLEAPVPKPRWRHPQQLELPLRRTRE